MADEPLAGVIADVVLHGALHHEALPADVAGVLKLAAVLRDVRAVAVHRREGLAARLAAARERLPGEHVERYAPHLIHVDRPTAGAGAAPPGLLERHTTHNVRYPIGAQLAGPDVPTALLLLLAQ